MINKQLQCVIYESSEFFIEEKITLRKELITIPLDLS